MILWVVLFLLVVAISFVLAVQSMRDFSELPEKEGDYSLFLIRKTSALNAQLLDFIKKDLTRPGTIVSIERLFKGQKSALVIFAPRFIINKYKDLLDLLELEDYTSIEGDLHLSAWEMGIKDKNKLTDKVLTNLPNLHPTEHFWWQVVFSGGLKPQITAVLTASDASRKHSLTQALESISPEKIHKLPKAFSNAQLLEFYQKRSFRKENKNPFLTAEETLNLIAL